MQVFVRTDAIERHQMQKEVAKPAALSLLKKTMDQEHQKATDPWYRARMDHKAAEKNAKSYRQNYERVVPEVLTSGAQNMMWRRAKQLKDQFTVGMLSKEEMHPVKGFTQDGKMVWVVDEEKMRTLNTVARNTEWEKRNGGVLREYKNIMRHLCPQDANAGDIEKFRPSNRGMR